MHIFICICIRQARSFPFLKPNPWKKIACPSVVIGQDRTRQAGCFLDGMYVCIYSGRVKFSVSFLKDILSFWSFDPFLSYPVLSRTLRREGRYEIYIYISIRIHSSPLTSTQMGNHAVTHLNGDDGLLISPSLEVRLVRDVSIGVRLASGYHPPNHCGAALREKLKCC